jgi:chemotaxis protein methyltransferase CheR
MSGSGPRSSWGRNDLHRKRRKTGGRRATAGVFSSIPVRRFEVAFTFFFRDQRVLNSIVQHVIPSVMGRSSIRVWDAGCASGEETYSVAMLLFDNLWPFASNNLRIDATDIEENSQFANTIATGIYSAELLKGSPHQELLSKYSRPAARSGYVEFDIALRNCIFYQRHDLRSLRPIGDNFSLVVCKNVLLHLAYEQRVEVIRMFYEALSPCGYLALDELQEVPLEVVPLFAQVVADGKLYRKAESA